MAKTLAVFSMAWSFSSNPLVTVLLKIIATKKPQTMEDRRSDNVIGFIHHFLMMTSQFYNHDHIKK